ncbi:MAG: hypothetical protein HY426_02520 [Candidatus Levybacteria bacterium]|nr:hypothetical protein [Candidatus Levybacteria bacterium]
MDKFEKEYFESLRVHLPQFENKLNEVARERIKMFSAAVTRQLLDEKQDFDLIMGPGNSGLFMSKIAKLVYEELQKEIPLIVNVPIERILEEDTVTKLLVGDVKIPSIENKTANILFVDDEIMRGLTAKVSFELLIQINPGIEHIDATIIAENHFFEWHWDLPKVSVKFFAYARLIQWINGTIGHFIPDELFEKIKKEISEVETHNDAMAAVVGGGLKKVADSKPYYDLGVNEVLKTKIGNYEEKQKELMNELRDLVKTGVEDYKSGKIKFRF